MPDNKKCDPNPCTSDLSQPEWFANLKKLFDDHESFAFQLMQDARQSSQNVQAAVQQHLQNSVNNADLAQKQALESANQKTEKAWSYEPREAIADRTIVRALEPIVTALDNSMATALGKVNELVAGIGTK